MAEALTPRINLVEKIGKNKVRAIAALGIAAAAYLGISGKPNSGGGIKLAVWQASLEEGGGKTILGIYPGFETNSWQKQTQTKECYYCNYTTISPYLALFPGCSESALSILVF